ncbi:sodium:calcium antiporter [Candidatus Woesearchaeota archaeon]|nr:sodium:calcium antiporter [Candidatus Woesearchaeota archaeon]
MSPLVFYIIIFVICLYIISKSADYAIGAVTSYAKKTGVSKFIIGFLVVSFGTTFPEMSTAVMASLAGESNLLLGDLIGASIIDVALVFSIAIIIARVIKVKVKQVIDHKVVMVIVLVALSSFLMMIDGRMSRLDGGILLAAFCIYLIIFWKKEEKISHLKKEIVFRSIWQDIVVFGGCIAALLLSARWLVISAVEISYIIQIPKYIVGLLVIAIGTTIPEITVNVKSALKHQTDIGFGNIFGSVVANLTLSLSIAALIRPFDVPFSTFGPSILFLIGFVIASLFLFTRKKLTWKSGVIMLAAYVVFVVITILRGF